MSSLTLHPTKFLFHQLNAQFTANLFINALNTGTKTRNRQHKKPRINSSCTVCVEFPRPQVEVDKKKVAKLAKLSAASKQAPTTRASQHVVNCDAAPQLRCFLQKSQSRAHLRGTHRDGGEGEHSVWCGWLVGVGSLVECAWNVELPINKLLHLRTSCCCHRSLSHVHNTPFALRGQCALIRSIIEGNRLGVCVSMRFPPHSWRTNWFQPDRYRCDVVAGQKRRFSGLQIQIQPHRHNCNAIDLTVGTNVCVFAPFCTLPDTQRTVQSMLICVRGQQAFGSC